MISLPRNADDQVAVAVAWSQRHHLPPVTVSTRPKLNIRWEPVERTIAMAKQTGAQIVQDNTEALAKKSEAAVEVMKGNAEALTDAGAASRDAIYGLTKAYQELATKERSQLDGCYASDGSSEKSCRID
jgi:hypothetical protein